MPAKGHRQSPDARAKIAAARQGRKHSHRARRAISLGMQISHAIRTVMGEDEKRRAELRELGYTEAEIDDRLDRDDSDEDDEPLFSEEDRARWRARGATDAQIDEAIAIAGAKDDAEKEKWRQRWRRQGATDAQIDEALYRVFLRRSN